MVIVAQLVRAPDCGSGGRRFETGLSPLKSVTQLICVTFFLSLLLNYMSTLKPLSIYI